MQFDEIVNFRPVSAVNGSGDLTYAISPALPTGFTFVTSGDNAGYVTGSSSTESNGSFKVTITDGSGKSASAQFTLSVVAARPRVTSLSKSSAKASSGDKITATGVFPSSVISVTVNGVAASISGSPTSTSVDFVLPKVSRPGTVNVIVKTAKDGDSDPVSFTYTPDPMSAMALREKITLTNEVPISVPIPVIAVAGGSGLYSYSITGLSVGNVSFSNPFTNLRMTPDGKPFTIRLMVEGDLRPVMTRAGTMIVQQWKQAGIDARVDVAQGTLLTRRAAGDFDAFIGWSVETWGGHQDLSYFMDSWHSAFLAEPGKPQPLRNWQRWSHPELDGIIEKIRKIGFDDPKGVELGHDYVKLVTREMPFIPLMAYNVFTAMDHTYWTGFPTSDNPYANPVTNWGNSRYMFVKLKPTN